MKLIHAFFSAMALVFTQASATPSWSEDSLKNSAPFIDETDRLLQIEEATLQVRLNSLPREMQVKWHLFNERPDVMQLKEERDHLMRDLINGGHDEDLEAQVVRLQVVSEQMIEIARNFFYEN
jgi:formyltetrahydrofolate hydrolase